LNSQEPIENSDNSPANDRERKEHFLISQVAGKTFGGFFHLSHATPRARLIEINSGKISKAKFTHKIKIAKRILGK
jgi:hypothetical protein